jgi:hypothetical protein
MKDHSLLHRNRHAITYGQYCTHQFLVGTDTPIEVFDGRYETVPLGVKINHRKESVFGCQNATLSQ